MVWHNPFDVCRSLVALVWRQRFGKLRPPLITASSCVSASPGAPGPSVQVGPQQPASARRCWLPAVSCDSEGFSILVSSSQARDCYVWALASEKTRPQHASTPRLPRSQTLNDLQNSAPAQNQRVIITKTVLKRRRGKS